jgi:hypothetical protein
LCKFFRNAISKTNEKGIIQFEFDLSDSITSFRANVDAFTETGIIGFGTTIIASKEPFYIGKTHHLNSLKRT